GLAATVVRVRRADGTIHPHAGRIDFIDTQVDRNTDTILVRAVVPNPLREPAESAPQVRRTGDRELIDGQFVTVVLEGPEPVEAVVVPRAAVLQDQGGHFVFVVGEGNRAERRNVRLGRGTAEIAVVEEGL